MLRPSHVSRKIQPKMAFPLYLHPVTSIVAHTPSAHVAHTPTPKVTFVTALGLMPVPAAIMKTLRRAGGTLSLPFRKGPCSRTVAVSGSCVFHGAKKENVNDGHSGSIRVLQGQMKRSGSAAKTGRPMAPLVER